MTSLGCAQVGTGAGGADGFWCGFKRALLLRKRRGCIVRTGGDSTLKGGGSGCYLNWQPIMPLLGLASSPHREQDGVSTVVMSPMR